MSGSLERVWTVEPALRAGLLNVRRDKTFWRAVVSCAVVGILMLAARPAIAASSANRVLRLAGNPAMAAVIDRWAAGFQQQHPDIRVETHLTGSDTGMAALYTGRAEIALLGRAPTPSEIQAFEWVFHYKPAQCEILTGSLARPGQSPALVLFVHRDNPLNGLSLAQLDAIFGTAHRLAPADIRTWGQLGLTGEWADKPIHLYGPDAMSGTGRFFRHVVLADGRMMNWAQLTEFSDTEVPRAATHDAGRQILSALAKDRYGLALASFGFPDRGARSLAIDGVTPTRGTVTSREYPLHRPVLACFNRQPGTPVDPVIAAFLRYILSAEGQQAAASASACLPLTPALVAEQAAKLD
jgi:phosphate transport system substrate-binding protein